MVVSKERENIGSSDRTTSPMSSYTECAVCAGAAICAIGLYLIILIPILLTFGVPILPELSGLLKDVSIELVVGLFTSGLAGDWLRRRKKIPTQEIKDDVLNNIKNRNTALVFITIFLPWFLFGF